MPTDSQISTLLDLPQEIRNEIYSYLLDEHNPPPPNPSYPGGRRSAIEHLPGSQQHSHFTSIRYAKDDLGCKYFGLLSTSRQIRLEVLDLIRQRLTCGRRTVELDIMFKGYQSWPTWIHFPLFLRPVARFDTADNEEPSENVSKVELDVNVDLRIFSTEGFRRNDGWPRQPGSGLRDLYTLLLQGIHDGPDFGGKYSKFGDMSHSLAAAAAGIESTDTICLWDMVYKIKTLTVNIIFHDIYTKATHPESVHQIFKALKELALSGSLHGRLDFVRGRAKFVRAGKEVEWKNEWQMSETPDRQILAQWNSVGLGRMARTYSLHQQR